MPTPVVVTQPAEEPLTLEEAKAHCKVHPDVTADDDYITRLLTSCRSHTESRLRRAFVETEFRLSFDGFPTSRDIELFPAQVTEVSAVTYFDANGDPQTLDAEQYVVDTDNAPGRIVLLPDYCWPSTQCGRPNSVSITFTAGYGEDGDAVPANVKQAIGLLLAHHYDNRSAVEIGTIATEVPLAYEALIAAERWC